MCVCVDCRLNGQDVAVTENSAFPELRFFRNAMYLPQRDASLPFVNRAHMSNMLGHLASQMHQNSQEHIVRNFYMRLLPWCCLKALLFLPNATSAQQKAVGNVLKDAIWTNGNVELSQEQQELFAAEDGISSVQDLQLLVEQVKAAHGHLLPISNDSLEVNVHNSTRCACHSLRACLSIDIHKHYCLSLLLFIQEKWEEYLWWTRQMLAEVLLLNPKP